MTLASFLLKMTVCEFSVLFRVFFNVTFITLVPSDRSWVPQSWMGPPVRAADQALCW